MKNIINKKIKFRENYRPFAPLLKKENLQNFLYNSDNSDVKFMEKIYKFKPGISTNSISHS